MGSEYHTDTTKKPALDNFLCGISVILISNCGVAVFSVPARDAFFWHSNGIKS